MHHLLMESGSRAETLGILTLAGPKFSGGSPLMSPRCRLGHGPVGSHCSVLAPDLQISG